MSVKTLDDDEREIEISDELESILLVLVYEASKYLQSNCEDVAGFMSMYFDNSWREKLRFFSGPLKRTSMEMGKIIQPDGTPLIFLRPGARRPLPTRASDSRPSASSPGAQATSKGSTVPDDPRHPIQTIIDELMPLFKAHYVGHGRPQDIPIPRPDPDSDNAEVRTEPQAEPTDASALALSYLRKKRVAIPRRVLPDPETEELAKALKTHNVFGYILVNAYDHAAWPANDKLPDQVRKGYNRMKRSTGITKGNIREDAPPIKKRKPTISKVA